MLEEKHLLNIQLVKRKLLSKSDSSIEAEATSISAANTCTRYIQWGSSVCVFKLSRTARGFNHHAITFHFFLRIHDKWCNKHWNSLFLSRFFLDKPWTWCLKHKILKHIFSWKHCWHVFSVFPSSGKSKSTELLSGSGSEYVLLDWRPYFTMEISWNNKHWNYIYIIYMCELHRCAWVSILLYSYCSDSKVSEITGKKYEVILGLALVLKLRF